MEEEAVAEPVVGPLSPSSTSYKYGFSDKSRAARRRRIEIRRFKMIAANAAASSGQSNNKRQKLSHHHGGVSHAEEAAEEDGETQVTEIIKTGEEKVTAVSTLPLVDLASRDGDRCPPHGVVSICGGRREMEDALRVVPALEAGLDCVYHFFGVYDGHGGSQAALHCKERLHKALAEGIRLTDPKTETEWKAVMKACFLTVDVEVGGLCGNTKLKKNPGGQGFESREEVEYVEESKAPETVGSTAVVAVVSRRQILVANCGDSRAVLCRGGRAIPLSMDHKPEVAEEMARIEAAGGRVIYWNGYRVLGVLAMSRAIGDKYLKPYVIAEPEVSLTERCEEDECLIVASDGLWDVVSNEEACELCRKCLAFQGSRNGHDRVESQRTAGSDDARPRAGPGFESPTAASATLLTKLALARGSADNISIVVVDLRKPPSEM